MVKQLLILISFSFVCLGQTKNTNDFPELSYKDITEIKGLIYVKSDTSLFTGRVIRYNKKNEAKRYINVTQGKPDIRGWIQVDERFERPKESVLGEVIQGSAIITGAVMAATGNDLNMPYQGRTNEPTGNELKTYQNIQKDYIEKVYDEMSERSDISHDLELNNSSENEKIQDKSQLLNTRANKKDGAWELYYPNKSLESRGNYKENKK